MALPSLQATVLHSTVGEEEAVAPDCQLAKCATRTAHAPAATRAIKRPSEANFFELYGRALLNSDGLEPLLPLECIAGSLIAMTPLKPSNHLHAASNDEACSSMLKRQRTDFAHELNQSSSSQDIAKQDWVINSKSDEPDKSWSSHGSAVRRIIEQQSNFKEAELLLETAEKMQHSIGADNNSAATVLSTLRNNTVAIGQSVDRLEPELPKAQEAPATPAVRKPAMLVCHDGRQYPLRLTCKKGDVPLKDYVNKEFDEQSLFIVDRILDERKHGRGRQYLIKWKGYELDPDDWTAASNLKTNSALDRWENRRRAPYIK